MIFSTRNQSTTHLYPPVNKCANDFISLQNMRVNTIFNERLNPRSVLRIKSTNQKFNEETDTLFSYVPF